MKNNTYWLLGLCLLFASTSFAQKVPTFTLREMKQEIAKQDDTLRVVNFWATWCKPCVEELPEFLELASHYQEAGEAVKFILIAVEDKMEKVQAFAQNKKPFFYVLTERDPNLWIPQIDAKWEGEIPATLIINAKHGIRTFQAKKMTRTELENSINPHLKKK